MVDRQRDDQASPELQNRADVGVIIYERLLPAVGTSVGQARCELADVLGDHAVSAQRRDDITVVLSEAATNSVMHAYPEADPGPLYVTATLTGSELMVSVTDAGRGMCQHPDSPGLGLGIGLMKQLTDELRISSDDLGTSVHAIFKHACPPTKVQTTAAPLPCARTEMLMEYYRALTASYASLRQDTQAVLAQARQTIAHANRLRRRRARQTR